MCKWLLNIYGNGSLLDFFTHSLNYKSDEGRIVEYNLSDYYFTSSLLNSIEQESEALSKAKELLVIFNGVCYLLNLTFMNFVSGSIQINNDYKQNSDIYLFDKFLVRYL